MRFSLLVCVFLVHFVAGCASTVSTPVAVVPESAVAIRAQERWDALFARDMEKAYGFISPAGRISMTLDTYRGRVNPQYWRKIAVKEVICKPDLCDVTLDLDYSVDGLALKTLVKETWIYDSGKWWLVYKG